MSEPHNAGRPSPGPAFDTSLTCRVGGTTRTARGSDEPHTVPDPASVRRW